MRDYQMNVLLISPFYIDFRYPLYLPSENLGLGYIASYLRRHKISVDIFDANMLEIPAKILMEYINIFKYDLVGITASSHLLIHEAKKIATEVKEKNKETHVTVGGHFATFQHKAILENAPHIDSVVRGDGEETVLELVKNLSLGKSLTNVRGLSYRNHAGRIKINNSRYFFQNLDNLSWPARDSLNYIRELGHTWPTQISSSRGCYGNCAFCDIRAFYGKNWRYRNERDFVDEIVYLKKEFKSTVFRLTDDEFIGPKPYGPERAKNIAKKIIKRGLTVELMIDARANDVDRELFFLLKEAGVVDCLIGIESGVDRLLRLYNKGLTVSQNLRAIEILKDLEINLNIAYIMFDPRMTFLELKQNYLFLKKNNILTIDSLKSWLWPFVGTSVVEHLRSERLIIEESLEGAKYKFADRNVEKVFRRVLKCKEVTYPLEYELFRARKYNTLFVEDLTLASKKNLNLWIDIFENALADPNYENTDWVNKRSNSLLNFIKSKTDKKEDT
jgi:radical SAM superfamily enzyme YgiQ (UPF0313 family)